ncbi:DUF3618 domain-containing protein [Nonomuraea sp. NPDC050556]|uniref:DUF3618 domain-containing protein n=1 Tax=Nonomuraea sp. NPDC050556 TaxID=3364369 RepID=UPI0037A21AD0
MTETDPGEGFEQGRAGEMGARRKPVGAPVDSGSVNVPQTRPGAAENALAAEAAREPHETFVPEPPNNPEPPPDDRTDTGEVSDNDEETQVRKDISDARKDLGDTVEALADKMDVKARASDAADMAKDKAVMAADIAKDKAVVAADKAKEVAKDAMDKMPDQVKDAADTVTQEAKKRPILVIAAVGTILALIIRRMMKRGK